MERQVDREKRREQEIRDGEKGREMERAVSKLIPFSLFLAF